MKKLINSTVLVLSSLLVATGVGVPFVASASAAQSQETHVTTGVVKKVDTEKDRVTLAHDEVPSLKWPSMTMAFAVQDEAFLDNLEPGQEVTFSFIQGEGGMYVITDVITDTNLR